MKDVYDVIVIGGGQAGIATGYLLKKKGISFAILDANERVGDSWRNRYDSLVLFTTRTYSSLTGLAMEGSPEGFPTKDEMADYLESYVNHFNLPVNLNVHVNEVKKSNRIFEIHTSHGIMKTNQVIIATGAFQKPYIPSVIEGDVQSFQMHSSFYLSPKQIPNGSVLIVGGGNSGAQIAVELAKTNEVTMAVSQPFKFLPLHFLHKSIFRWLEIAGLLFAGNDTRRGKWFRKQNDPIFGYSLKKLIDTKQLLIKPRVINVKGSEVTFEDNSKMSFDAIIWSTGFTASYDCIKIEGAISQNGDIIHHRGISPVEGLYFLGLPWQHQRGSALICGVSRDASYLMPFIQKYRHSR